MVPYKIFSEVMCPWRIRACFGDIPEEWLNRDKYLLNILLVAAKTALTGKWFSQESDNYVFFKELSINWNYLCHTGKKSMQHPVDQTLFFKSMILLYGKEKITP